MQGRNEVRWRLGRETSLAPPCSNLRFFGNKCTVLKKVLMTLLWLFGPCNYSAPGEFRPLLFSLRLRRYSIRIRKFSENKQIFKCDRHELLFCEHLQFSNTIAYRMDLAQTVNKGYWWHFKFLRVVFVSLQILSHAFFRRGPVFLLIMKLFRHWTSYFFEVR